MYEIASNSRLNSATEECLACENKVIEYRRLNAKLEKQVERLKSDGNSKMQNNKIRPVSRGNKKLSRTSDELHEEIEMLQTKYVPCICLYAFMYVCGKVTLRMELPLINRSYTLQRN